jgi:hypothetical protein
MRRRTLLGLAAVAVVGACTAAAMVLGATPEPRVMGTSIMCRSTLIPAYLAADDLARIAERPAPGRVVVVNPHNGPGAEARRSYRAAVAAVQLGGTRVLGYVHTGYGARPAADVLADATRYRAWYGVDGVFLDEAAEDDARLPYYRALAGEARAAGLRLVALNPGTVPARGYFDVGDIVVTFEGPYAAYGEATRTTPDWLRDVRPTQVAHLVYDATPAEALSAAGADGAGFLYATSGELPDPWSTLPPYLDELEARLGTCP